MQETWIASAVSIVMGLIGRFWLTSRPERVRRGLTSNLELYASLDRDPDSEQGPGRSHPDADLVSGRAALARLIRDQVTYLDELERKAMQREYDSFQLVIVALFGVPLGYGAYLSWEARDAWYLLVLAFILALFTVIIVWLGIEGFFKGPARSRNKQSGDKVTEQG